MLRNIYIKIATIVFALACAMLSSCNVSVQDAQHLNIEATVFPDYAEVTMPCNMAAPTFVLSDSLMLESVQAVFSSGNATCVVEGADEEGFCIDQSEWRSLIAESNTIAVRIQGKKDGKWVEYNPFNIYISNDTIDTYLAYRLIEPGYEQWNEMGIYQRNLETYDEEPIITNKQTNGGCMNCHSFCQYNPSQMLFHLRADYAGTYISNGTKPSTFTHLTPSPSFVYPSWHPSGKFVAFSQNNTKQLFHTTDINRIEVFDYSSDVVVYDIESQQTLTTPLLTASSAFETFPSWSPDGKTLYFCSADSVNMPDEYEKVHYSLCSISFDPDSHSFGETVDTLYKGGELKAGNGTAQVGSVSFPRISPDNKYLIFTLSEYGNFSIWHKDAKLMMLDMSNCSGKNVPRELSELGIRNSYHSWSSNSHWLIFSSRRDDGLYTRPYITHIDAKGNFTKPFALPQSDASFYDRLMKSFNIPEFIKGKVEIGNIPLE